MIGLINRPVALKGLKNFKYKHLRNIKEEESDGYGNGKLQVLPIPEEIG